MKPLLEMSDAAVTELALEATPRADADLLEGGSWSRTQYRREADARIALRQGALLDEHGIDQSDFDVACRLVDDQAFRERVAAIARRPDLARLRTELQEIAADELAELRDAAQRCVECGGNGAGFHERMMRVICADCVADFFARPSTPPVNGIRSALARARRARLPATLTNAQWQAAVDHFADRCAFCAGPWCLVEHATPIELGGGTTAANCLPSCTFCNVNKGGAILENLLKTDVRWKRCNEALHWLRQQGRD